MINPHLQFSRDVCSAMVRDNVSLKELAERLGVTPSRVSQIRNGENLTIESMELVARALNLRLTVQLLPLS